MHKRLRDIDGPIRQGIDGVFEKGGKYFIVEAKYKGQAKLNTLGNNVKQMSDRWIKDKDRLYNAVGKNGALAEKIEKQGYTRLLAEVSPDGTVVYKELDANADVIGIFTP